jgi:hypothetical protein
LPGVSRGVRNVLKMEGRGIVQEGEVVYNNTASRARR